MKVVYLEKRDRGATLTCWIVCHMWLDWAAAKEGLVAYYHWPREYSITPLADAVMFAREPNMFDWWFTQPNQELLSLQPGQRPPRDEAWMWEEMPPDRRTIPGKWPMGENTYAWYRRLRIRPEIVARADALAARHGLDLGNTIGVSWRGCESRLDFERDHASEAIENYFPHIDRLLEAEPGLGIFATAEEQGVAEQVRDRYPGRTVIMPELWTVPRGYGSDPRNPLHSGWCNPVSGYERGVLTCLLLSLLSRCKYYVKNKSNMSHVAQWMKGGQGVVRVGSRAHPEFWG